MTPPPAESIAFLMCEDARYEFSRRWSFMGVFGPTIQVPRVPSAIPGLCAAVLILNPRTPIQHVTATLENPHGKTMLRVEGGVETPFPEPPFLSHHILRAFPVLFDAEGEYRWTVGFNRDPEVGIEHKFRVRVGPPD